MRVAKPIFVTRESKPPGSAPLPPPPAQPVRGYRCPAGRESGGPRGEGSVVRIGECDAERRDIIDKATFDAESDEKRFDESDIDAELVSDQNVAILRRDRARHCKHICAKIGTTLIPNGQHQRPGHSCRSYACATPCLGRGRSRYRPTGPSGKYSNTTRLQPGLSAPRSIAPDRRSVRDSVDRCWPRDLEHLPQPDRYRLQRGEGEDFITGKDGAFVVFVCRQEKADRVVL